MTLTTRHPAASTASRRTRGDLSFVLAALASCSWSAAAEAAPPAPVAAPSWPGWDNCNDCQPPRQRSRSESVREFRECGVREEDSVQDREVGYRPGLSHNGAVARVVAECLIRRNLPGAVPFVAVQAWLTRLRGDKADARAMEMMVLRARLEISDRTSARRDVPQWAIDEWQTTIRRSAEAILRHAAEDGVTLSDEDRAIVTAATRFVQAPAGN